MYVLIFPWHPQLRSPNELCRLWQARAIVDDGKLSINETMQRFGPVGDLALKDGLYYPSKAPLMSFLAAPIYWVLKKLGGDPVPEIPQVFFSRLILTLLPTLLLLVYVRRFLIAYLQPKLAQALVVTYALGSLAFSYSEAFFSHQATAVLLFLAFYVAWRAQRGELKSFCWAVSGVLAGAAVMAEYTAALTVLGFAAWVAVSVLRSEGAREVKLKRLGVAAGLVLLGAAPFLVGLMAYHQVCYGGPLVSGYKYLNDTAYQGWHVGGFLGIRLPDARAFVLSFFSPLRGLFMLSPFLLFALPGLRVMWKDEKLPRDLFWLTAVLLVLNAYFTASFTYDSWGWSTGPRHMTPFVPFLLLPVGLMLEALGRSTTLDSRLGYGIGLGLLLSSVAAVSCIVFVNYVPDSLSTSLFGLSVPLFELGYLPPTVLNFLGWANPGAGVVVFLLLAVVLVGLGSLVLPKGVGRAVGLAALAGALTHLGLLEAATRHDAADLGAVAHLKSAWLSPPGEHPKFW